MSTRVAHVASEYPPFVYGGLGTHVAGLTAELAAQGVQVDLVVPDRQGYHPPPPGVRLLPTPVSGHDPADGNAGYWTAFGVSTVARVLDAGRKYDLVHCHDWMAAWPGAVLRAVTGIPLVFSVHLPQAARPNLDLEVLGITAADVTLVSSEAVRAELARRDSGPLRAVVLPSGVDISHFRPPLMENRGQIVLFVGRMVPQKGVDMLLRSFAAVRQRLPDARLMLAGDGDQALYLRRMARYFGLPPQVGFIGWQTGDRLVELYQQAQVVAMPSRYEPFGLVALEAMACGRPVVATRTGGLAEIVMDGHTGFLVPPGDHLRLAGRLVALLLDEPARLAMGTAGRARSLNYSWRRIAEATGALYEATEATGDLGLEAVAAASTALPGAARRQANQALADLPLAQAPKLTRENWRAAP